jgi:hypothetical protein
MLVAVTVTMIPAGPLLALRPAKKPNSVTNSEVEPC